MASALSSPWSITGIILLVLGGIILIIGIVLLVMFETDIRWWATVILIIGFLMFIGGGIALAIGLGSKKKKEMFEPNVLPTGYETFKYKSEPSGASSAVKSGWSIAGIVLLVFGSLLTIVGIILVISHEQDAIPWWAWVFLVVGIIILVVGGISLIVGLRSKPAEVVTPKPSGAPTPYTQVPAPYTAQYSTASTTPYSVSQAGAPVSWSAYGYNYPPVNIPGTSYHPYTGQPAGAQSRLPAGFTYDPNSKLAYNSTGQWYDPVSKQYYDPTRGWYVSTPSSLRPSSTTGQRSTYTTGQKNVRFGTGKK